ncbi:hypothetical protein ACOSQ3_009790 [Xanthoceras sorbifolium]
MLLSLIFIFVLFVLCSSNFFLYILHFAAAPTPARNMLASSVPWSPPPIDSYKLNTDASIQSLLGATGLGVLIRDGRGSVILSGAQRLTSIDPVDLAEALAVKLGLSLAKETCHITK